MTDEAKKPSAAEMRTRLLEARRARDEQAELEQLERDFARLELREQLEKETNGKEGKQFAIYDASAVGEGLFAVKLGPAVLFQTFMDSERTPVDRCDFVTHCIAHPSKEDYLAARGRRPGIDIELSNRLAKLYGLDIEIKEGK